VAGFLVAACDLRLVYEDSSTHDIAVGQRTFYATRLLGAYVDLTRTLEGQTPSSLQTCPHCRAEAHRLGLKGPLPIVQLQTGQDEQACHTCGGWVRRKQIRRATEVPRG